jgi:autotransporter-associated beta strand protein
MKQVPQPPAFPSRKLLAPNAFFINPVLLLSGLLAALCLLAPKAEAQSTWAGPAVTTGTLVGTGTAGDFYEVGTNNGLLAVGDAIYVSATAANTALAANSVYYVIAVTGSAYEFSLSPGGAIDTALTNTAGATDTTLHGVYTWDAAGETDLQSGASWTGGNTPDAPDAVANITTQSSTGGNFVAIVNSETVGYINFSGATNDLNLISSNNGSTTTLSALTFATTTGTTPVFDDTSSNHIIRLGGNDASARNGQLVISGTQGLILEASNPGTQFRIDNVNWSGFTNGNGGVGTLTIQSGTAAAENANVLGSGTGAINLTVGNASASPANGPLTTGSAGAILISIGSQSVNVLSGATNGYIYSTLASTVWTLGAGNGTGGNFAGIIGVNPYLSGTAGDNNITNISLVKTGAGIQTISGQIVGSGTATNTVTVNAGTLILSGSNSYGGATSVTGGTLSLQGADAVTLNTVTVSGTGSLTETAANALGGSASLSVTGGTATLSQANSYSGTTSLSSGALYVNNAGALGSGTLSLTGGTIDATNGVITGQSNNPAIAVGSFTFGGSNNLNLGTGPVSITGSTTTITLNGSGGTLTLGGTATNTNSSQTAGITMTVNGAGNTLVLGGFTLGTSGTQAVTDTFNGSGNISINGAVTNGTAFANGLTYAGSGTLMLSGSNNYSGATIITSGTVKLGNVNALGTGAIGQYLQGALDFNGNSITNAFADKAILGGTLTDTGAAVNLTGMGNIGASASRSFFFDGTGNMTFGQQFTGAYSVTKNGSNTVTLSGAGANALTVTAINNGTLVLAKTGGVNAVNGASLGISGGTLQLAGSGGDQINNGTGVVLTSGVFDMNGQDETIASLKLAGTGISGGGALINSAASTSSTLTGVVTLTANSSLGGSGNLTVASSIGDSGSGYSITKIGAGVLTLPAGSGYTGATSVTNGTLIVTGSLSGTVSTSVASGAVLEVDGLVNTSATNSLTGPGAVLRGIGKVGSIMLNSDSILAPGLSSSITAASGTLTTIGPVTFMDNGGSSFNVRLGVQSNASGDNDQLLAGGTVTLDNSPLNVTLGAGLNTAPGGALTYIIINGGAGSTGGGSDLFDVGGTAIAENGTFMAGGYNIEVFYATDAAVDGGAGNDVALELTAIPEPGPWATIFGGMGLLVAIQRMRSRKLNVHRSL